MTFRVGLAIALASSVLIYSPSVAEEDLQTFQNLVKKRQQLMNAQRAIVDKMDDSSKKVTDKLGQRTVGKRPGSDPGKTPQRSGRR